MFTPLITHDLDGTALAAPVNTARCNGATYKTRTIDDLRIKDDRLRAAIEGTGSYGYCLLLKYKKSNRSQCRNQ